jgi:hypothetical protein
MENRLIFLYHRVAVNSEGVTQEGRNRRVMEVPVQASRVYDRQIRHTKAQDVMGSEI